MLVFITIFGPFYYSRGSLILGRVPSFWDRVPRLWERVPTFWERFLSCRVIPNILGKGFMIMGQGPRIMGNRPNILGTTVIPKYKPLFQISSTVSLLFLPLERLD